LFSLDVITLRSLPLYIAPIVIFAVMVSAVLSAVAPPPGFGDEAVGLVALLASLVCALTTSRLYQQRQRPDLSAPFFLNAAGLTVYLADYALHVLFFLWDLVLHRTA